MKPKTCSLVAENYSPGPAAQEMTCGPFSPEKGEKDNDLEHGKCECSSPTRRLKSFFPFEKSRLHQRNVACAMIKPLFCAKMCFTCGDMQKL